jgi:MFS family permease
MSFWQMFYSVGSFIAYWVSYATSKHPKGLGEWDWKMVVIFQILMPLIILSQIFFIPESPRWYIQKSRNFDAARRSLIRVRDTEEEVNEELLTIREALEFEAEAISSGYSALWKDKSVRKRMYIAMIVNGGQQITGQGTLNTYSSIIYKKVFNDPDKIALINALNATFGIIFTLNATWTVDRFGRKFLFILGGIGMGICMLIGATVETQTPSVGGTKSQPVGIAIVFIMFLFAFFCKSHHIIAALLIANNPADKPSWGATVWIFTAEIFSMNIRAQAVGMCSQTQNVVNSIVQQFFPVFLKNEGFYAFYMFAGINFLLAAFVWFFVPETAKVSLETMDAVFGGANHVDGGAEIESKDPARHQSITMDVEGKVATERRDV